MASTTYDLYLKGYVGDWHFSSSMVDYVLDQCKDKKVCVLIDSLGGMVATAISISTAFKRHGNVHCHYVGMNASAATIASMGAKRVTIDAHALFLVHKCMNTVFEWDMMNSDQLEQHIKQLQKQKDDQDTIDGVIAGLYASRCKKPKDELLELMKTGAWLTAEQALEWGFVDEITDNEEDEAPRLTQEIRNYIAAAGIPRPPCRPIGKTSMLERFLNLFYQLNRSEDDESSEHNPISNMSNKSTPQANQPEPAPAAQPTPATTAAENSALADMQARAEAAERKAADMQARAEAAERRVAELEAQPGDTTSTVIDSTSSPAEIGPSDNPVADAFELLKMLE